MLKLTCLIRPILSPMGSLELNRLASLSVGELLGTLDTLSHQEREIRGVWYSLACAAQGVIAIDFLTSRQLDYLRRLVRFAEDSAMELPVTQRNYLAELAREVSNSGMDAA